MCRETEGEGRQRLVGRGSRQRGLFAHFLRGGGPIGARRGREKGGLALAGERRPPPQYSPRKSLELSAAEEAPRSSFGTAAWLPSNSPLSGDGCSNTKHKLRLQNVG
ncbi:Hypothetical predicted protein [Podarcis lilfordi]|uniref:Uncharacterized protein n=1 Tax=Podarcis lilfordi TaxID=74358 RepID=A0AA35L784_9SAUR|nr:Hypothetical predicted protein [Podarcis lilfordi]